MMAANPFNQAPALVQALGLPARAYVGQRIAKTLLTEQIANLPGSTAADKRLVNQSLAELHWLAALKPATCGLAAWQTDTHDYLEIAVLHAALMGSPPAAQAGRLIELIHRTIPYPVVLVVSQPGAQGSTEQLSLAHKRLPAGNRSAMVLEQTITTQPIQPIQTTQNTTKLIANKSIADCCSAQFVQYLALTPTLTPAHSAPRHPCPDLYSRYSDWLHAAQALAAAQHTGQFTVSTTAPEAARRRNALAAYDQLGQQLVSLRAQARKESQLGQRALLNIQITKLMAERQAVLGSL